MLYNSLSGNTLAIKMTKTALYQFKLSDTIYRTILFELFETSIKNNARLTNDSKTRIFIRICQKTFHMSKNIFRYYYLFKK